MQDKHVEQALEAIVGTDEGFRSKHDGLGTPGARACIALKNGHAVFAEAKDPSEGPRPSQHRRIDQLDGQVITVTTSHQLGQTQGVLHALPAT